MGTAFKLLRQITAFWALGVLLGSVVSVYATGRITSALGRLEKGWFAVSIAASALGILSPICMFGTIPLIAALGQKRIPQSVLASFMVSSILLNPNLLMMTFALGPALAAARIAFAMAAGVLAGVLVHFFFRNRPLYDFSGFKPAEKHPKKRLMKDIWKSVRITGPYFIMGVVLTALIDRYLPRAWVTAVFAGNRPLGVLIAASVGVPVYVCGGGSIPLILNLLRMGMSPGSAVAFMISGPATKITNLGAVKIVLGAKNFALYLAYMIVCAVLAGWLTDFLLSK